MAITSANGRTAKSARAGSCSSGGICRKKKSARVSRVASPDAFAPVTDTRGPIPSVTDRVEPIAAGAPVVAAHFLGARAVFTLGEETLLSVAPDGAEQRATVH